MRSFTINEKQVLIANVDGNLYAMDARCPHMHGYLPEGRLQGDIITCPAHDAQYDVAGWKLVKNIKGIFKIPTLGRGASDLSTYEIQVDGDKIKIIT